MIELFPPKEVIIESAIVFGRIMFGWLGTVYIIGLIAIMMDKLEKERKEKKK